MKILLLLFAVLAGSVHCAPTYSAATDETRYCGQPMRDSSGAIYRSSKVRAAFIKAHPCPTTGLTTGACHGWQVDHVIPLACGGCDVVWNLAWLPIIIKSGPGQFPKDRWERKVYCSPQELVPMPEQPHLLMIAP